MDLLKVKGNDISVSPAKLPVSPSKLPVSPSKLSVSPSRLPVSPSKLLNKQQNTATLPPTLDFGSPLKPADLDELANLDATAATGFPWENDGLEPSGASDGDPLVHHVVSDDHLMVSSDSLRTDLAPDPVTGDFIVSDSFAVKSEVNSSSVATHTRVDSDLTHGVTVTSSSLTVDQLKELCGRISTSHSGNEIVFELSDPASLVNPLPASDNHGMRNTLS